MGLTSCLKKLKMDKMNRRDFITASIAGAAALALAALKLKPAKADESDEALSRTMKKYHTEEVWEIQRQIEAQENAITEARQTIKNLEAEKRETKKYKDTNTEDLIANLTSKIESQENAITEAKRELKRLTTEKRALMKECDSPGARGHKHLYKQEKAWDEGWWHYEISRCIYCGKKKTVSEDYFDYYSDPCFIATAAYGSPLHPRINALRTYRDRYLPKRITACYYKHSPPIANWIRKREPAKKAVRAMLIPITELARRLTE